MDIKKAFALLQNCSARLDRLKNDVAQFESQHPLSTLESIENEIQHVLIVKKSALQENTVSDGASTSVPTDYLTSADLDAMGNQCKKKLQDCRALYEPFCIKAEKITEKIIKAFCQNTERLLDHYVSKQFCYDTNNAPLLFKRADFSPFSHYLSDQLNTWEQIKPHLPSLFYLSGGKKNSHNALNNLLNPDIKVFFEAIEDGILGLHDEIGQLAIWRLRDLSFSQNKSEKIRARKLLGENLSLQIREAPLYIDLKALETEIFKLAVFALMYPDNKTIWLGTSRAVNAMIKHHAGEAIYLNPDPKKLNWQLNKAWLLAAQSMDYQFKLVEQHFPSIEKAILTNNPARFLEVIASELRPDTLVSQYNGSDAPTSTSQEILLLLSTGSQAIKHNDGSIRLVKPMHSLEDQPRGPLQRFRKSHSHAFFNASSPPPLAARKDHFTAPGKEEGDPPVAPVPNVVGMNEGKEIIGLL